MLFFFIVNVKHTVLKYTCNSKSTVLLIVATWINNCGDANLMPAEMWSSGKWVYLNPFHVLVTKRVFRKHLKAARDNVSDQLKELTLAYVN